MPVLFKKEKKVYDFTGKNPNDILTADELKHYDEGMSLKNSSFSADTVNFKKAVEATVADFPNLLP
jgi:hypothetical protein